MVYFLSQKSDFLPPSTTTLKALVGLIDIIVVEEGEIIVTTPYLGGKRIF